MINLVISRNVSKKIHKKIKWNLIIIASLLYDEYNILLLTELTNKPQMIIIKMK